MNAGLVTVLWSTTLFSRTELSHFPELDQAFFGEQCEGGEAYCIKYAVLQFRILILTTQTDGLGGLAPRKQSWTLFFTYPCQRFRSWVVVRSYQDVN